MRFSGLNTRREKRGAGTDGRLIRDSQGRVHPDADRQLRGRADTPPLRHDRHRVPLLECVPPSHLVSFLPLFVAS